MRTLNDALGAAVDMHSLYDDRYNRWDALIATAESSTDPDEVERALRQAEELHPLVDDTIARFNAECTRIDAEYRLPRGDAQRRAYTMIHDNMRRAA